jgi:hypothetical protein
VHQHDKEGSAWPAMKARQADRLLCGYACRSLVI